jgi:hypothetical protein
VAEIEGAADLRVTDLVDRPGEPDRIGGVAGHVLDEQGFHGDPDAVAGRDIAHLAQRLALDAVQPLQGRRRLGRHDARVMHHHPGAWP